MARAATTSDAFNARGGAAAGRAILGYLALQERPVGRLWIRWGWRSRRVEAPAGVAGGGTRHVRRDGRRMPLSNNAEAIRPLHEWTETFERFWRHQLSRVQERAERKTIRQTIRTGFQSKGGKMISTATRIEI